MVAVRVAVDLGVGWGLVGVRTHPTDLFRVGVAGAITPASRGTLLLGSNDELDCEMTPAFGENIGVSSGAARGEEIILVSRRSIAFWATCRSDAEPRSAGPGTIGPRPGLTW
ncbi:hypothetical protein BFN03_05860 [Rhodococcus sp. WMMA185]|nr:hypothetical protein BFN03_05860 [Rhodococcus sp. WMMA185]